MKKKPALPPKITVFLDDEERELIESIEQAMDSEEWKPLTGKDKEKALATAKRAARNTLAKNARLNIRMNQNDLRGLKAKAAAEGMPYQTLLASLVQNMSAGS